MSAVSLTWTGEIEIEENKIDTYSKTIEQIHEHNNDEENKRQEENSAEMGVKWEIWKLQFSNKHWECLDKRQLQTVKIWILLFNASIFVEQNIKSKSKSNDEERVPGQEEKKGLEDSVEHCEIGVVVGEHWMPPNHCHQIYPRQEDGSGG